MATVKERNFRRHFPSVAFIIAAVMVSSFAFGLFVYAGVYNIAADAPHTPASLWILRHLRERSIAVHSRGIAPPATLGDPATIAAGAGLYAEMCTSCHLAPGMARTEMSQGLYPPAPEFFRGVDLTPAEEFWVIKHGVKLTAMPAWGRTHSDALIWDMVAFLRVLPSLDRARYEAAVKSAPADHDEMMEGMAKGGAS